MQKTAAGYPGSGFLHFIFIWGAEACSTQIIRSVRQKPDLCDKKWLMQPECYTRTHTLISFSPRFAHV